MASLFLYGTLRHLPLLSLVLGRAPNLVAARLQGHAVHWAAGESFPMICADPDAVASGLLLRDISAADRARLDFYESAFSYRLKPVTVETEAGPAPAEVYFPDTGTLIAGEPWSLDAWVAKWGALTVEAATEVMGAYGHEEAASVAARFGMIRARAQSRVRAGDWHRPRTVGTGLGRDDITVETVETPYRAFFTVEEYRLRHRLFDGTLSGPVNRAVFRAADAVTVLPYDPVRDLVLLIEQVRVGVYAHGDPDPWLLEPVAGIIDAGDSAEDTARREAVEEAGVTLGALHHVASYYPTPGGVAQRLISYVGICDLPMNPAGGGGLETEGEDIRSHLVSFDHVKKMLQTGELANAPLIISVQWLVLHRDDLRAAAGDVPVAS